MVRQAIIGHSPEALYNFMKQYEDILFGEVTHTEENGIEYVSAYLDRDDPTIAVQFIFTDGVLTVNAPFTDLGPVSYGGGDEPLTPFQAAAASTGATLVNQLDFAYGTDNGFMLHFTYDSVNGAPNLFTTIMVVSGSDGDPFIIYSNPGSAPSNNDLTHLTASVYHYPDTNYLTFTMCQFDTEMQTLAVPFAGFGNIAAVSYAKHAFWMPVSNSYGSGFNRMSFQETECVTNGYWFLDDKPDEEVP